MQFRFLAITAIIVGSAGLVVQPARAADIRSIIFPVFGKTSYTNDFGAPRVGHTHQGNDIFAPKHTPLLAAADGHVQFVAWPEAPYGYFISLAGDDGYDYWYIHINNDRLGTDDGHGGGNYAYAPGIEDGAPVVKGQVIGWLGDSGNAETTAPHLHFEIHRPDGNAINPYQSLKAAPHLAKPVIAPPLPGEFLPYNEFRGGANITLADLDPNSPGSELVTGAGPKGGPLVRVLTSSLEKISTFYAYAPQFFHGGVDVAVGDINRDGTKEIITGPGAGASPFVRIFSIQGVLLSEFLAYPAKFLGGVHVAAADLDGDGQDEIITGPGPGSKPEIHVYRFTGELLASWSAYTDKFRGGADVSAVSTDVVHNQPGLIVTGALRGGGPEVRVFTMDGTVLSVFNAFAEAYHGGIRVAAARQVDGQIKIAAVPNSGGGGYLRQFTQFGLAYSQHLLYEEWWRGGFDVATDQDQSMIVSGPGRRASLRTLDFGLDQFHRPFSGQPRD